MSDNVQKLHMFLNKTFWLTGYYPSSNKELSTVTNGFLTYTF